MNSPALDRLVNAVLYEGYILYPYRASSPKNQRERFTFGRVYPETYSVAENGAEPCAMQTECLLAARPDSEVQVSVRFLHPMWREIGALARPLATLPLGGEPEFQIVPQLSADGKMFQTWMEAVEQRVHLDLPLARQRKRMEFNFPGQRTLESIHNAYGIIGVIVRRQEMLKGVVEVESVPLVNGLSRIRVRILNHSPWDPQQASDVMMRTFASTHTILKTENGEFFSLMDPPPEFKHFASACRNIGTWPVLAGTKDEISNTVLSSPIVLYDFPEIAPESDGDFFDGTEIDEMLKLRVTALAEGEKRQLRADGFARRILERADSLNADGLMKLHGTMREVKQMEAFFNPRQPQRTASVAGIELKAGDRVRLRPKYRADAFDMILAGKTARIEAVERDAEDRLHFAVVLEDDPGRDLGMLRQPGHRFFYHSDEVEPLLEAAV